MANRQQVSSRADPLMCAKCGREIDVRPGESYIGSMDGRVWHYGCNPPRPRPTLSDDLLQIINDRRYSDEFVGMRVRSALSGVEGEVS